MGFWDYFKTDADKEGNWGFRVMGIIFLIMGALMIIGAMFLWFTEFALGTYLPGYDSLVGTFEGLHLGATLGIFIVGIILFVFGIGLTKEKKLAIWILFFLLIFGVIIGALWTLIGIGVWAAGSGGATFWSGLLLFIITGLLLWWAKKEPMCNADKSYKGTPMGKENCGRNFK